jgi:fatty-acid desaturase
MLSKLTFHHKLMFFIFLHIILTLYSVIFHWNFLYLIISFLIAKLFNALGNEIALHRLWTHKSFKTSRSKEYILHFFSTPLLYGSNITYAGIHRTHHTFADTEKDPHITKPWWKVVFYVRNKNFQISNKMISDLVKDPLHRFQHKYYFILNTIILIISLLIFGIVNTGWFLSFIVTYNFIAAGLVNVLGHSPRFGVKIWPSKDNSTNNKFLEYLTWSEGYHNFHHYKPNEYYYATKKGEFDFPGRLIKIFFKNE